jgi:hypothetical protein
VAEPIGTCWIPRDAPHDMGRRVAAAFAAGSGFRLRDIPRDYNFGVLPEFNLVYGILHGAAELIQECRRQSRQWLHVDHGYFGRNSNLGDDAGHFRISLNRLQESSLQAAAILMGPALEDEAKERANKLNYVIFEQRMPAAGNHVIVLPPSPYVCAFDRVFEGDTWQVGKRIASRVGKTAVLAPKGSGVAEHHLAEAAVVVGYNSMLLLKASTLGIPVFATGPCAASPFSLTWGHLPNEATLTTTPPLDVATRAFWYRWLALNQFTLEEMGSGVAWSLLQSIHLQKVDA